MRILVTNDDGIRGEGLRILAEWAKRLGSVTIAAPAEQQSGKSQSLNLRSPWRAVRDTHIFPEMDAWEIDSTPADCVRFAFDRLGGFDLVLAGINSGFNVGFDIPYSGTVGAVLEGRAQGCPGIALSADFDAFEGAEKWLDPVLAYFRAHRLMNASDIWNVNFPKTPRGIRITRQGGRYFRDHFLPREEDIYEISGRPEHAPSGLPDEDLEAVLNGWVSVMPLSDERTDLAAYESLRALNKLNSGTV